MEYFLFLAGFGLLIYGADLLVSGASNLARKLNISEIVIGLTIVSFGTSAPELFISVTASISGSAELAIANVLGSNIFNIFVIIGAAAIVQPIPVLKTTTWKEIPFSLLSAIILGVCSLDLLLDGQGANSLGRIDGMVFLAFFIIFIVYSFDLAKKGGEVVPATVRATSRPLWQSAGLFLAGLAMLFVGGRWIVGGADEVGRLIGLSESVIGLTIVATATSLPELVTSIIAARRNNPDIAIGNAIGSNIFNIFLILGVSSVIHPLPYGPAQMTDTWVVLVAHVILFLFVLIGRRHRTVSRLEGMLLILAYILFIWW